MGHERILIAEGDIALSEMLKDRLEALGYLVDCARNGNEAMDIFRKKWVDLIITAVVLRNGMDGYRLIKELKRRRYVSNIPIIVQTNHVAMKGTFELLGIEAFFSKPYSVDLFLEEVKDILTRKVLVIGNHGETTDMIMRGLFSYGLQTDRIAKVSRFYEYISSYRYNLAVIQNKVRSTFADKLVSALRQSRKNKKTPVIVYAATEAPKMDAAEARETAILKERCKRMDTCEFMGRGYSQNRFMQLLTKFLE